MVPHTQRGASCGEQQEVTLSPTDWRAPAFTYDLPAADKWIDAGIDKHTCTHCRYHHSGVVVKVSRAFTGGAEMRGVATDHQSRMLSFQVAAPARLLQ